MLPLGEKSGIVMVLVLAVVAMLTAVIVTFKSDQGIEQALAYNFRDSLQSQYLGSAGVEAAVSTLAKNDNDYDYEDEDWGKFAEGMIMITAKLQDYFPNCSVQGKITDECSKLDLNMLVKFDAAENKFKPDEHRVKQLRTLMIDVLDIDITTYEFDDLAASVCDWLDTDTEPNQGGAEDEYYRGLDSPYDCKNGYMDTPEEILLVKGMKKEWYYGEGTKEGIQKYVTIGTGGMVNLNTASREVLKSLAPGVKDDMVDAVINERPIEKINKLVELQNKFSGLDEDDYKFLTTADSSGRTPISIKSTMFSVDIKGIMPSGATVSTYAKLYVDKGAPTIVYYKIY